MAKTKSGKPYYKGDVDRIFSSENDESEFKLGLFFKKEHENFPEPLPFKNETLIASVGKEIWDAYLDHRYRYEEKQYANVPDLILADGSRLSSYRQEQKKERRLRKFFVIAHGHPKDMEIRVEVRDGKKIVMIKKGNGASPDNPVIRRYEIKLVCHLDEPIETILAELPEKYKQKLGFEFNRKSGVYESMQTNSMRLKTKVRDRVETEFGIFDFVLEPAYDLGSGLTLAEGRWPIREFEDEVKGIYTPGREDDLKVYPEKAGLTEEQIGHMCTCILRPERDDLDEFATLYLLAQARKDPGRYGDICVDNIFSSKSTPGLRLLKPYLDQGEKGLKALIRGVETGKRRAFVWD